MKIIEKNRSRKKQLLISSAVALLSFAVNISIGFWCSPFIVSKIGAEAHGFSSLGANFTTYASLITVAVNAFAGRYITIAIHKNDLSKANRYFTSVFYANIVIAVAMLLPMSGLIVFVDRLFSVPVSLINDVKIQWAIMLATWLLNLVLMVFSTVTFVKDRLDIDHGLALVSTIVRFAVLITIYNVFTPKLWYIGIAALISDLVVTAGRFSAKQKLMPEIHIRREYFDWECLVELISKGIWNSINSLAALLMNGFDLVIANLAVNSMAMGLYSIAQIVPTYLQSLMYTFCNLFTPSLTAEYAEGKNEAVREGLILSMKINSLLLMVPLTGFMLFGLDFYRLWQYALPQQDVYEVYILSILVILPMISSIMVQPLLTVNTITAHLKLPVAINSIMGILNIVIELILVKTTELGIYAIAGVSSILLLIRNYAFYPVYSARNLSLSPRTFYPQIMRGTACFFVVAACLFIGKRFVASNTWAELIACAVIFGIVCEAIVFLMMLNREERKKVILIIRQKIGL